MHFADIDGRERELRQGSLNVLRTNTPSDVTDLRLQTVLPPLGLRALGALSHRWPGERASGGRACDSGRSSRMRRTQCANEQGRLAGWAQRKRLQPRRAMLQLSHHSYHLITHPHLTQRQQYLPCPTPSRPLTPSPPWFPTRCPSRWPPQRQSSNHPLPRWSR